ncbi:MAG TPA: HPr(Ser) kinase/phosphatase [Candidatus Hydrogenedentes bacterium]|nr:HPr(Ser) kinase/phosphatase [Candidatus Hydrogenedentota bacterium]
MDTRNLPINRKQSIAVARLLDRMAPDLELGVIAGYQGIGRQVFSSDINRPGLALGGYLDYFANDRVQILGNTETHYMEQLESSELQYRLNGMFSFEVPAFVLSRNLRPPSVFLDECNRRGVPVLRSRRSTDEVISRIILFLADEFSPETSVHGTAVDCYGVGCLIVGPPGIGKSETALELVERGHRLVADDFVALRRQREDFLYAQTSPVIEHHMEIRGVGIIDVKSVYGVGCVRNFKRIGLVVELAEWQEQTHYDRTGLAEDYVDILEVKIPKILIPVRPGRNLAIIIEVASLNYRLKELGEHPARVLNRNLIERMGEDDV